MNDDLGARRPIRSGRAAAGAGLLLAALATWSSSAAEDDPRSLIAAGRYAEAEASARFRLAEAESRYGPDSLQAAETIDLLVEALWRAGRTQSPEARDLAARAVAIKERLLGPGSAGLAGSLHNQGALLWSMRDFTAARPIYEKALALREQTLGPDHPDLAVTLTHLAVVYESLGDFSAALPLHRRGLAITERNAGASHPDVARSCYNLANCQVALGKLQEARLLYERALGILEARFGASDLRTVFVLQGLGYLSDLLGDYERARSLYERVLAVRERVLGPDHPDFAHTLNTVALLLHRLGDYTGARERFERSLSIRQQAFKADHPLIAQSYQNLADLYRSLGDYRTAREFYETALRMRESAHGPVHPEVATTLDALAGLLKATGDRVGAQALRERTVLIWEKALGPDHVDVAGALTGLAVLVAEKGDRSRASTLQERALRIREQALGSDHPFVAENLQGLASLTQDAGKARLLYERALALLDGAFDPTHPALAPLMGDYGILLARLGQREAGLDAMLKAELIGREHLRLTARTLPERQALQYAAVRSSGLDAALSLAAVRSRDTADAARRVWDSVVRSRALVLDEMGARRAAIGHLVDPQIDRLAHELEQARLQLARIAVRGLSSGSAISYSSALREARDRKERAEGALAESSLRFRQEMLLSRAGLGEVVATIPRDGALVAYVLYEHMDLSSSGLENSSRSEATPAPAYLAFVSRGTETAPRVVRLGGAAEVEELVAHWQAAVLERAFGALGPVGGDQAERDAGRALREAVWDPVALHLGDARRVFIVPDGALNFVSLAALPTGTAAYLVEQDWVFQYLSTERDLVPRREPGGAGAGLLVVADPAFDRPAIPTPAAASATTAKSAERPASPSVRGEPASCLRLLTRTFDPLPASAREAQDVASLWQRVRGPRSEPGVTLSNIANADRVDQLLGSGATEAAVRKGAPGRRVLHLATHGFFLGSHCGRSPGASRGIGGLSPLLHGEGSALLQENPLLLGGLALAGANQRSEAGSDEDDGILTGEEIAALDLSSTETVVLSACDTGLGSIEEDEGVLGLRRAFQIAGAGTVVMSLWPVEDDSARRWMAAFYRARFVSGLGTAEAVRRASLETLRHLREIGGSVAPAHWGAFVSVGR